MTRRTLATTAAALLLVMLTSCGEDDTESTYTGPSRQQVADEVGCIGFEAIRAGSAEGDEFLCSLTTTSLRIYVFDSEDAQDLFVEFLRQDGTTVHSTGDGWVAIAA